MRCSTSNANEARGKRYLFPHGICWNKQIYDIKQKTLQHYTIKDKKNQKNLRHYTILSQACCRVMLTLLHNTKRCESSPLQTSAPPLGCASTRRWVFFSLFFFLYFYFTIRNAAKAPSNVGWATGVQGRGREGGREGGREREREVYWQYNQIDDWRSESTTPLQGERIRSESRPFLPL